ncbi:MAG: polysaccharide biosynthesis C-terminal domain-containing protein, partial [Oscillospiraceae bacterium]
AYLVKMQFVGEYAALGTVLGEVMPDAAAAEVMIASLAAAGSIFGVSMSTFAGWLFLVVRSWFTGDGIRRTQLVESPKPHSDKYLFKQICRVVFPISLSAAAVSITGLIDGVSILGRLDLVIRTDLPALYASHAGILELAKKSAEALPNYLYGVYGLGTTLFSLVPSLTGSFGMSALPHVSAAWAAGDINATKTNMQSVLRLTMLVAAPAGMGLSFLAGPIANLLYGGKNPVGARLVVPMLALLGVAAIFVAIVNPINALLQAIGKYSVPVILMVIGGIIKLASNYFLVAVPQLNIKAAPMGNLLCFLFITIVSIIVLSHITKIKFDIVGIFVKPMLAGALTGAAAMLTYNIMSKYLPISGKVVTVAAIAVAGIVYIISLGILNALEREDVLGLPGGNKICRILEKLRILR